MLWYTYTRVSREEQARLGFSLPSQREACRAKALEAGATHVLDFCDEGVPGDLLERPGLRKLREAVADGGATGLIVYDPDRLARNLSHQLLLTEEFERAGLRLEFVNFEWQQSAEGRLFYAIRGAIAEYEREKIRERTVRGRRQKARMGGITGHPHTYGYHFDPLTDTLSIIPEQAETVRMIFRWVSEERIGTRTVAARLEQMGIPPARAIRWWPGTIRRMLRNTTYIGIHYVMRYQTAGLHKNRFYPEGQRVRVTERPREEWIALSVPAVVDAQTWAGVQDYMAHANRIWRAGERTQHLLTGLTTCGLCGRAVSGVTCRGYRYYRCTGSSAPTGLRMLCSQVRCAAQPIEEQTWQRVAEWLDDPQLWPLLMKRGSGKERNRQQHNQAEILETAQALAGLPREKQRVITLFQKALITEEEATTCLIQIREREATLCRRQQALSKGVADDDQAHRSEAEPTPQRLAAALSEISAHQRRILLHWLVEKVLLYGDRVIIQPKRGLLDPTHRLGERPASI